MDDIRTSPFQDLLGYRLTEWSEGHAVLVLELADRHRNRGGTLHGGVVASLMDSAMGFAACYCPVPGRTRKVMTLSMNTAFLGSASAGRIVARGSLLGGGRKIVTCEARLETAEGVLLATAQGVFKYTPGSDAPDGIPL